MSRYKIEITPGRPAFCLLWLLVLLLTIGEAEALPPSCYANSSVLSSGHWVKIRVDTSGVYRIGKAQLAGWGFEESSKVKIYGYGACTAADNRFSVSYPDDLVPAPFVVSSDGDAFFYARGSVEAYSEDGSTVTYKRNSYDSYSYYFIGEREDPHVLETKEFESNTDAVDHHLASLLIEREVQNPMHGGAYFHGHKLKVGEAESFDFNVTDMVELTEGRVRYYIAAGSDSFFKPSVTLSPEDISVSVVSENCGGNDPKTFYSLATGIARFSRPEDEAFSISLGIPSDADVDYAAVDYACALYSRYNRICPGVILPMRFGRDVDRIRLFNADKKTEIWDVSDVGTPFRLNVDPEGFVALENGRNKELVAFRMDGAMPSPEYVGEVANQNLHGLATPEMIIVTTDYLRPQAEELAAVHRCVQGLDVAVVGQEEIFNEFSSGARHPSAIRRFVKMLYDRNPGRLKNLLLYGSATWDPRGLQIRLGETLPSFEAEIMRDASNINVNYCADQYYGMLADNFNPYQIYRMPMDINVGRIPASSRFEAKGANRKITRALTDKSTMARFYDAILFSDRGDDFSHLEQSLMIGDTLRRYLPSVNIGRADIYLDKVEGSTALAGRKRIASSLARGCGFMSYCGHALPKTLTSYRLWDLAAVRRFGGEYNPFVLLATCETFVIDSSTPDIGKAMVSKSDGGSIGLIASARKVYLDHNRTLSAAVAREYASLRPGDTYGDIMRRARNSLVKAGVEPTEGANILCYNYGGDPAVPVIAPDVIVSDITLDGKNSDFVFKLFESVRLQASVKGADGSLFDGLAEISIYAPPLERTTVPIVAKQDTESRTVLCDGEVLYRTTAPISNGNIDCQIIIPEGVDREGSCRLTIVAISQEFGFLGASGAVEITISGSGTVMPEQVHLEIVEAYIDEEANPEPCFVLVAKGAVDFREQPGRGLTIKLDSKTADPFAADCYHFDDEGRIVYSIPLGNLAGGRHIINYSLQGIYGAPVHGSLSFIASGGSLSGRLTMGQPNPARATVNLDIDSWPEGASATLLISSADGTIIYRREDIIMPFTWDLRDNEGRDVADGCYRAWLLFESDYAVGASNAVEIVVIR